MVDSYLRQWQLVADGAPFTTHTGTLVPVVHSGAPAMLKVSSDPGERLGGALMAWWNGDGAARVLARDDGALLLERATGPRSLAAMARAGDDDEACRVLCAVAARLHAPRAAPTPETTPLAALFRDLEPAAAAHGGVLARSAATARALLAAPQGRAILHGDLHHDNVLDFGARGWLAIDPKGVAGERGFDLANVFTNPDLADPTRPIATVPARFARRLAVVAGAADLDRTRLLQWILAWCGLSASWYLQDDDPLAAIDLAVAALAAAALDA
jgi:streptomycin 6-kinase